MTASSTNIRDTRSKNCGLKERRIFKIANPFLGPEVPFNDKRLWFDPQTYK